MKVLACICTENITSVLKTLHIHYPDKKWITHTQQFAQDDDDNDNNNLYHQIIIFNYEDTMMYDSKEAYKLLQVRRFDHVLFEKLQFPHWEKDTHQDLQLISLHPDLVFYSC